MISYVEILINRDSTGELFRGRICHKYLELDKKVLWGLKHLNRFVNVADCVTLLSFELIDNPFSFHIKRDRIHY
jgi:hypothetical protein